VGTVLLCVGAVVLTLFVVWLLVALASAVKQMMRGEPGAAIRKDAFFASVAVLFLGGLLTLCVAWILRSSSLALTGVVLLAPSVVAFLGFKVYAGYRKMRRESIDAPMPPWWERQNQPQKWRG
jgi:hypothetical protein